MEENYLIKQNTFNSINQYFEDVLQNDNEKIYEFLLGHFNIRPRAYMYRCIKGIKLNDELSNRYKLLLFKYVDTCRKYGTVKGITFENIKELAGFYNDEQENELREIVDRCSSYKYALIINRTYAQEIPSVKNLKQINSLIDLNLSLDRILYVYMNTTLRRDVNLDYFISALSYKGYSINDILNNLNEYWFLGTIKYVQENKLVRMAAGSISISRLIAFYYPKVPILNENEKVVPKVGMKVRFKIKDYLGDGRFRIYCPYVYIE